MIDLDRFKIFNDTYGHQSGDRLLAETARSWQAQIRTGDLLARFGGEEFVLLLPTTSSTHTARFVERMRDATPRGQTFSCGITSWDGIESADELVARADAAMYQAKADGRARTLVADASTPRPTLFAL